MAFTFRLAVENAKFGQPEVKLGMIAGYGERSGCRGSSAKAGAATDPDRAT